jgi:predicted nuclease of predicted toxin-antitoxin system
MILVADEGVERQIVERLRREGHQVRYEAEDRGGAPDESVLADAASGAAMLVTTDKDFGELVFRLRKASHGVILLRLAGLSNELKAELVASAIALHKDEMPGAFVVIEPGSVRIRRAVAQETGGPGDPRAE